MSVVNIGIDYIGGDWKLCLLENAAPAECLRFSDQEAALRWLAYTCTLYPEPGIGFSSRLSCAFSPLPALTGHLLACVGSTDPTLADFLLALSTLSQHSYCLPTLKYSPTIPAHRRLLHPVMGTPNTLCSIATLLSRMRQGEASWSEMRFLCLEVGPWSATITVIQDGLIIDSIDRPNPPGSAPEEMQKLVFWEGLTQDLGGLMAVHHFEDIVISQQADSAEAAACKEQVIERLGDLYQCYLYPQTEHTNFEACLGAALLVDGLSSASPNAELTARLLSVVA